MPEANSPFLSLFEPYETHGDRFLFQAPKTRWKRVYGGLVVSQALAATLQTVKSDRSVHSLHAYFLLAGDPAAPIMYEVGRLRDGKSFSTRHCRAVQNGQVIFVMTASFHCAEQGLEHHVPMPEVTPPDALLNFAELQTRYPSGRTQTMFEYFDENPPLEFRPVNPGRYFPGMEMADPHACQLIWFRATHVLPDNKHLHQCILAYVSDMTLLDATVAPHGRSVTDGTLQPASLDHAIWFHRPFRSSGWHLYVQDSPNAGNARGLAIGRIYSRQGILVASMAQEGLIRLRLF